MSGRLHAGPPFGQNSLTHEMKPFHLLLALLIAASAPLRAEITPLSDDELAERLRAGAIGSSTSDSSLPGTPELMVGLIHLQKNNIPAAYQWLEKAARIGHPQAAFLTGLIYLRTDSSPDAPQQAVYWLERAASMGAVDAQTLLATLYYKGRLGNQDFTRSYKWACKAALAKHPAGAALLSDHYFYGTGTSANLDQSIDWLKRAIAYGAADAEQLLESRLALKNRQARSGSSPAPFEICQ